LLGDDYQQSITVFDESLNEDDKVDSTLNQNETNEEIETELKIIDDIEQEN
jgi:hypothetical protein